MQGTSCRIDKSTCLAHSHRRSVGCPPNLKAQKLFCGKTLSPLHELSVAPSQPEGCVGVAIVTHQVVGLEVLLFSEGVELACASHHVRLLHLGVLQRVVRFLSSSHRPAVDSKVGAEASWYGTGQLQSFQQRFTATIIRTVKINFAIFLH